MSTGQWDDPEYPYLPRYGQPAFSQSASTAANRIPWKSIVRWLIRGTLTVAAVFAIGLLIAGIVLFQAARQAWSLASLDKPGITISYWHEYPTNEDKLSEHWRDTLGDYWWSEVREISYVPDGYYGGIWSFQQPTEDDVKRFTTICSRFGRLQSFTITSDYFSCEQIKRWPHLSKIEHLDVESSRLTDADLAIIGQMTGLKTLQIAKARITSAGLGHLANLPNLENLSLDQVEIKAMGGGLLDGFTALTNLNISQSPTFGDEAILALGSLPVLQEAIVEQAPIGDRGLAHLLETGQLFALVIGDENTLTNECFVHIAKSQPPQHLTLHGKSLTDSGLAALEGAEVFALSLHGTALTDAAFASLANIKGLQSLTISEAHITGAGIKLWPADQRLAALALWQNPLTPEGIELLAKANCDELDISGSSLDDDQLMLFALRDDLRQLDVVDTQVTAEGVKAFYEARKKRHKATRTSESLTLICDFPEVAEQYYDRWGSAAAGMFDDESLVSPP